MSIKVPSVATQGIGLGQQVQNNNLPNSYQNINYSPSAFGAQQGELMQKAGVGLAHLAVAFERIQKDQNTAQGQDAINKFDEEVRKTHYLGDNAIYNKKGASAINAYKESQDALDKAYSTATQNLNPQAKDVFNKLYSAKRENILDGSARYEAQQRGVFKAETSQSLINNSIDDSIRQYNNPNVIKTNVGIIKDTINQAIPALPENATEEQIKSRQELVREKTNDALEKIYVGVIKKQAITGNTGVAQNFYKSVKDNISGANQIQIESMLREGNMRGQAQAQFDKIANSGKSEAEQLSMARSIKNPELRDDVEMRVKRSWNEPKTQQQRAKELALSEAWKLTTNGTDPSKIPLELWTAIDKSERDKIQKFATQGAPQKSNLITYADLKDQYVNNPDDFKKLNLFSYSDKLNAQDFQYFSEKQKDLLQDNKSSHIQTRSINEIAKQRLEAIGIDTSLGSRNSTSNKQKSALFFRALDQKVEAFTADNGRKPKESEVEQIIDKMTEQVAFDKGWFSRQQNKYKFEIDGNENMADLVVPESAKLEIIKQAQKLNPNIGLTEAQIKQIYAKKTLNR